MRALPNKKVVAGLALAVGWLGYLAGPASATPTNGHVESGVIRISDSEFGDIDFDLSGAEEGPCEDATEGATLTVDVTSAGSGDWDTEVTAFAADSYVNVDLDGPGGSAAAIYYVDVSLSSDPLAFQGGFLDGPNVYDFTGHNDLDFDIYETEDCEPSDFVCTAVASLDLAGTFDDTGTNLPSLVGDVEVTSVSGSVTTVGNCAAPVDNLDGASVSLAPTIGNVLVLQFP